MSEPTTGFVAAVIAAVGASVVGLFKWLLGREVRRNDDLHADTRARVAALDARVDLVERTAVTQVGVDGAISRLESTLTRHNESMETKLDSIHRRIDRLYEKEAK